MPFSLGGLIQGLTTGATGALEGVQDRKAMEQKARLQRLQEELLKAQAGYYSRKGAPGTGKLQHLQDAEGNVFNYNPEDGTLTPAMMTPQVPATPGAPAPTKTPAKLSVKPKQVLGYDKDGNAIMVTVPTPGATPQTQAVPGVGKPLTDKERVAGSQAQSIESSVDRMADIATRNPSALNQAQAAIKLGHYGVVGRMAAEAKNLLSDPEAQQFYTDYNNYLLAVTPTYGGARPTQQLMDLETNASLPGLMAGGAARDAALEHMRSRLKDVRAKAGRAAGPEKPKAPAPKQTSAPGYNPKFWTKP